MMKIEPNYDATFFFDKLIEHHINALNPDEFDFYQYTEFLIDLIVTNDLSTKATELAIAMWMKCDKFKYMFIIIY